MSTVRKAWGLPLTLVAVALLLTGCAGDPPALALRVTNEVNGQPRRSDAIEHASDCQSERITDEYGFAIDVANCEQADERDRPFESLVADVPDLLIRRFVASAYDAALASNRVCHDLVQWEVRLEEAVVAMRELSEAIDSSAHLGTWTRSPSAEALTIGIRDVLIGQEFCVDGAAVGDVDDELLQIMGEVASAYDDLTLVARQPDSPQIASDYWYHFDQVGHLREIERLHEAGEPVQVLFLGSSATKRAFDANLVTDELGLSAMNVGVPAMFMGLVDSWWATLVDVGIDPDVVVVGYVPMIDLRGCSPVRQQRLDMSLNLRERAYAALPVFDDLPAPLLLTGGYSYAGSGLGVYESLQTVRGTPVSGEVVEQERVDSALLAFLEQLKLGEPCDARVPGFERLLSTMKDQGMQPLIVALPTHPALGNVQLQSDRVAMYQVIAAGHGLIHLDLTELLQEHEFSDLTHANALGRERITLAVIDAMRAGS